MSEMNLDKFKELPDVYAPIRIPYFTCLCETVIHVFKRHRKKHSKIKCPTCKAVWEVHSGFVSGTGENVGWQLWFEEAVYRDISKVPSSGVPKKIETASDEKTSKS